MRKVGRKSKRRKRRRKKKRKKKGVMVRMVWMVKVRKEGGKGARTRLGRGKKGR
jgi:hypothetical protein